MGISRPHVGAKSNRIRTRANQNIPPALRRELMVQFGGCCAVKGCHNQAFLDLHHLFYPQPGKRPEPGSIIVLCGAHHDFVHRGSLLIDRDQGGKLQFHHADGRRYGAIRAPQPSQQCSVTAVAHDSDVRQAAEDALCTLGFRRAQVRAVLAGSQKQGRIQVGAHVGANGGGLLEQMIRHALGALTDGKRRQSSRQ